MMIRSRQYRDIKQGSLFQSASVKEQQSLKPLRNLLEIVKKQTKRIFKFSVISSLAFSIIVGCKNGGSDSPEDSSSDSQNACAWDTDDSFSRANPYSMPSALEGYICPLGDEDWYSFVVPAGHDLVHLGVSLDAPVSSLDLSYVIWDNTANNLIASSDVKQPIVAGSAFSWLHHILPGNYFLQVRDSGNDGQDVYHPYRIELQTSKDADVNEPNNSAPMATVASGQPIVGRISYNGDEDWYQIAGDEKNILRLQLEMPISGIEVSFRIETSDGVVLATGTNISGSIQETNLTYDLAIDSAGPFYVVVYDDLNNSSDHKISYQLQVSTDFDPDANENNDNPSIATEIGTLSCGSKWSEWITTTGYIASTGDRDWYHVETTGCDGGIVEAELLFNGTTSMPENFMASLRFVREIDEQPCQLDQDCQTISKTCNSNLDCGFFGNTCSVQGTCAGGGICMPAGVCGANWALAQATEAERGAIQFCAPVQNWSAQGGFHLIVSDVAGVSFAVDHAYTLRIRGRLDPDGNEQALPYSTFSPLDNDDAVPYQANAIVVPVHDCLQGTVVPDSSEDTDSISEGDTDTYTDSSEQVDTGSEPIVIDTETTTSVDTQNDTSEDTSTETEPVLPQTVPGCCGPNDWIEGYLSYTYDQDWYSYAHPCPGKDCMVRIVYDIGAGPVDTYIRVHSNSNTWFDNIASISDKSSQQQQSGYFGGTATDDTCFYAYNGHQGSPFWYYLSVRDTIFVSQENPLDGTWDWSAEQPYRFCIEKVASECTSPCQFYEGEGCGSPQ